MTASELEFFVFRESYEEAAAKGYTGLTPQNDYVLDYHILQTTKDEYLIRADPQQPRRRRDPGRVLEG